MKKIYDSFIFYNELDLLEIRLNVLNDKVDYFILGEASQCFNGQMKPFYFEENKKRYEKFNDKIIHFKINNIGDDPEIYSKALISPNTNGDPRWVAEFYQKEMMIHALDGLLDDDIIFVSDVDEIWNPSIDINVVDGQVYQPIQTAYPIYLNNKSTQPHTDWVGTRFSNVKTLKKYGFNHFRTDKSIKNVIIQDGGWHFSWLGCTHWDKWGYKDTDGIVRFSNILKYNREKNEENLPQYILQNKNKWAKYFL